jgi:protein SCO1/2
VGQAFSLPEPGQAKSLPHQMRTIAVALGLRSLAFLTVAVGVLLVADPAVAQTYGKAPIPGEMGPDAPKNVGFDQKLGATVPGDLELFDHDGKPVRVKDVVTGKPTVLVLHYNRCPKLCNRVIQGLLDALNKTMRTDPTFVAGDLFNVVFISIDPKESPAAARKARQEFHREYDRRADDKPGVWFLTASHGQGTDVADADRKVHEVAAAVGFKYALRYQNREYYYNPDSGTWATDDGRRELPVEARSYDYEHSPGVVVLTPAGVVSQYLGGLSYDGTTDPDPKLAGRDVRMALVAASGGTIGTVADMIAPYCFAYDSKTGHYAMTMRYVAILFAPVYLAVGYLAFRTIRQVWREPKLKPGQAGVTAGPTREGMGHEHGH